MPKDLDPKFIVDMNVGKLSVWLRVLGYDTKFINPIDDGELVQVAENENRILLTRDNGILLRKKCTSGAVRAFFTRGTSWREQLREVYEHFELNRNSSFSRCVDCNGSLSAIGAEQVQSLLPEHVGSSQKEFYTCNDCQKLYWPGGHWERMNIMLDTILS